MKESNHEISTENLSKIIKQPDTLIFDTRPITAYNGWAMKGEVRGGHISGAKSIPLQWTHYMDWVEVLDEKNITKERPIVVYGYSAEDSSEIAEKLPKLGYHDVFVYNDFVAEWTANGLNGAMIRPIPLKQVSRRNQS